MKDNHHPEWAEAFQYFKNLDHNSAFSLGSRPDWHASKN
jgi:hypothetical protein